MRIVAGLGTLTMIVFTLVFAAGCTTRVDLTPDPGLYITEAPVDANVGLFVEDAQRGQYYTFGGSCMLGMLNKWLIQTGPALDFASDVTFRKMFTQVTRLQTQQEFGADSLKILITPSIESFFVTQGLSALLVLHCRIVNRAGETIYEGSFSGLGSGDTGTAFFGGFFAGQSVLSRSATGAFRTAFLSLVADIREKVDFAPYVGP